MLSEDHRYPQNLLILRPDNLGDVVLFSGALKHIRSYYPSARISFCAKNYIFNYLEHSPYIDQFLVWEDYAMPSARLFPEKWRQKHLSRLFDYWYRQKLLHNLQADLLLMPLRSPRHGVYGEHTIASGIPATMKIGVCTGGDQHSTSSLSPQLVYDKCVDLTDVPNDTHEFSTTATYLQAIGMQVDATDLMPEVWTTQEDKDWAAKNVPVGLGSLVVGVCPGATNIRKLYPSHLYETVFRLLPDKSYTVVLLGNQADRAVCEEINSLLLNCPNISGVINLAGLSTIRQLIECLRLCDVILTADSASLHLSVAIDKPVVAIMGGGHFGRFYPWGNPKLHKTVMKPMDCYWCEWMCIYPRIRCIEEVSPTNVASELTYLIEDLNLG